MTPKEALEYLKNRITTLSLNHKIGSRDIAKLEVKDIVRGIETHVMPTLENAINELERLKKFKETFDNYELAKKKDFIAYENWIECEAELKKSIIELEDLIETFDNYILQLNTRIKINKEIIEENFDLNPSLCHDLEVENNALEFALMLLEGERK